MTNPPWEPPVAGTEVEHLLGALDRQRATFRWKADGLDAAGLSLRLAPSELTLGGLLKHLALVEAHQSLVRMSGAPIGPPWDAIDFDADPQWEFRTGATDPPAEVYALYDSSVAAARERTLALIADGGLDRPAATWPDGRTPSIRRFLFDLLEEYGRHTGQADMLREAVDGRVGEDPPPDWRP